MDCANILKYYWGHIKTRYIQINKAVYWNCTFTPEKHDAGISNY